IPQRHLRSILLPYTTLFRSGGGGCAPAVFTEDCNNNGELDAEVVLTRRGADGELVEKVIAEDLNGNGVLDLIDHLPRHASVDGRSEEHTSELQSRENLVCRL